jgi:hypothetical protein
MGGRDQTRRRVHSKRVTKESILEKKATEMLKIDERNQKLKEKRLNIDPFSLFD